MIGRAFEKISTRLTMTSLLIMHRNSNFQNSSLYCDNETPYKSGDVLGRGVRLEFWKAKHNVTVLDFENVAVQVNMTKLRDANTKGLDFLHYGKRSLALALEFALCQLVDEDDDDVAVKTPSGELMTGVDYNDLSTFCGVSISPRSPYLATETTL